MCGRYARKSDKQRIAEAFAIGDAEDFASELAPSYNVAPQSTQPVVRRNEQNGKRELASMRWGLIPSWAKDAKIGFSTINARSETVMTAAAFRASFRSRRCLIPADLFYEWQASGEKTKQPYAIGLKNGSIMGLAGLWERWFDKAIGQTLDTYSILTTEANALMAPIHSRMPVIVAREDYERWLAPSQSPELPVDLLKPFDPILMTAWKVEREVGNTRNNHPGLIDPMKDGASQVRLL